MLPNAIGVIIVNTTLLMRSAMLLETALSLPRLRHQAAGRLAGPDDLRVPAAFSTRPWLFWWPGLFIVIIALSRQLHRRRPARRVRPAAEADPVRAQDGQGRAARDGAAGRALDAAGRTRPAAGRAVTVRTPSGSGGGQHGRRRGDEHQQRRDRRDVPVALRARCRRRSSRSASSQVAGVGQRALTLDDRCGDVARRSAQPASSWPSRRRRRPAARRIRAAVPLDRGAAQAVTSPSVVCRTERPLHGQPR